MFESVAWFVEGGAEHSAGMARLLSYAAFNGSEGIIGSTDLQVRALTVPDGAVRIAPGACSILNRAAGSQYEAYVGRALTETVINIAPTSSSGGRSDMIVAMVKNPWLTGEPWPNPADPKVGPYFVPQVISGVSATATQSKVVQPGWSAIPLARIDIPANTGTITQSMIRDLRFLSTARSQRELNVWSPNVETNITSSSYTNFPGAQDGSDNMKVSCPEWATHATVRAVLGGIQHGATGASNVWGDLRIQLGSGTGTGEVYTEATGYNLSVSGGWDTTTLMCGANSIPIPATMRGKEVYMLTEARKNGGTGNIRSTVSATCSYEVEWLQKPDVMS